jgi:hypothetical protein
MKRVIVNLVGGISLLLAVTTGAAWLLMPGRCLAVCYGTLERQREIGIESAGLIVGECRFEDPAQPNRFPGWSWFNVRTQAPRRERHRWLGFYADAITQDTSELSQSGLGIPTHLRSLVIPYWALLTATSVLGAGKGARVRGSGSAC